MTAAWTKFVIVVAYLSFTIGFGGVLSASVFNPSFMTLEWKIGFLIAMVPIPLILAGLAQRKGRQAVPDADADALIGVGSFVLTAFAFVIPPLLSNKTPDVDGWTLLFAGAGLLLGAWGLYRGFHDPNGALAIARQRFRGWRDRASKTEKLADEIIDLHSKLSTCSAGQAASIKQQLQTAVVKYQTHVSSPKP